MPGQLSWPLLTHKASWWGDDTSLASDRADAYRPDFPVFPAKPTPAVFSLRLEFTHGGFQPQASSGVLCVFSQTFLENAVVLNGSQTQKMQ